MLSMHSVVLVALLPIPIRNSDIPLKLLDEHRQTDREELNELRRQLLHDHTFEQNPSAESGYYNILCADATSGAAILYKQHGMQIALGIATYFISSGMCVVGAGVPRTDLENTSLQTSHTAGGITTYIECSAIPTPRQPMPLSGRAIFTKDSMCFDIFPVS